MINLCPPLHPFCSVIQRSETCCSCPWNHYNCFSQPELQSLNPGQPESQAFQNSRSHSHSSDTVCQHQQQQEHILHFPPSIQFTHMVWVSRAKFASWTPAEEGPGNIFSFLTSRARRVKPRLRELTYNVYCMIHSNSTFSNLFLDFS